MNWQPSANQGRGRHRWTKTGSLRRDAPLSQESVEIHIEELVLHGFPPGDRYRIGNALQQELARLLETLGFSVPLRDGTALSQVDAGTVRLTFGASADVIGGKTALALHDGISQLSKPG